MPAAGQVFDLNVPALVGPWSSKSTRHPGLIVSRSVMGRDLPWIVVPMTGTEPAPARPTHVLLDQKAGGLDPPLWILCEYPTTIPQDLLRDLQPRGVLPRVVMAQVRMKLAWVMGLGFDGPPPPTDR